MQSLQKTNSKDTKFDKLVTENAVLKEEVKSVKRENKLLQTQLDLRDEKLTKLKPQIFYLAQTKCKDQPATAHKAKFCKMSHQKVSQHSSCSDSDSDSESESSACLNVPVQAQA